MNERVYLESGGSACPGCGSKNIEGGRYASDADFVTLEVECKDCNFIWLDIYKLVGMEKR